MNLRDLLAVRALVVAGTTKGAAINIGVSQPTVSRAVIEMEEHFGKQLFARHHGRLVPTAAALRVSRSAEEVSGILNLLQKDLREAGVEQVLRIGMTPDLNSAFIQQPIRRMNSLQHGIVIKVLLLSEAELAQALENSIIDVGLSGRPHPADEIEVEHMLSLDLCCILPLGHRLEDEILLTPDLLSGELLVGIHTEEDRAARVQNAFREAGVTVEEKLEVSSVSLACEFVGSGMGIAFCTPFDLGGSQYPIVAKPFSPAIECKLYSMIHMTSPMQQAARQFCRLVRLTNRSSPEPSRNSTSHCAAPDTLSVVDRS